MSNESCRSFVIDSSVSSWLVPPHATGSRKTRLSQARKILKFIYACRHTLQQQEE